MVEADPTGKNDFVIDPNSGRNLREFARMQVKPDTKLVIAHGPWTVWARNDAARRDVRDVMQGYFSAAMKKRNWTPWDDFPIDEMAERGHSLSDDTVTIIQAYLGVEDYVGNYVEDGLGILEKSRERRNIQLQWGAEEAKHAEAWRLVLLSSGRKTEDELDEYLERVAEKKWTMREQHPGLDDSYGIVAYAMLQERATFFNYDEMRKRIRDEYGIPAEATKKERARKTQTGAAGAFQIVGRDEIAHHVIFLDLAKIYTKYRPELMLDALYKVFNGFHMPATNLIPNSVDLEEAMSRTGHHTARKQLKEINNPVLDALGVDTRKVIDIGTQRAKMLHSNLGPQNIGLSRTGEFVLTVQPDPQAEAELARLGLIYQAA